MGQMGHGSNVHMGKIDLSKAFLLDTFSKKLSEKHFTDHTLQMYMLISPHCLCILPDAQTVKTLSDKPLYPCAV